ncbi:hypothetical protein BKA67DRAFT_35589 [Truncatella angustata]|uniref:Uncharacterized protein n=1 Tax=Truncatella angustata TaxID=152316 RepID=A0A9P9A1V9_9PEZI|nr:uncharacterized protein BKA67DRAFT_35589 [Truncatella angustata]KAH6660001.1 hypothetical protein BKA67DRAFT_35589 [Truncatella angustata]
MRILPMQHRLSSQLICAMVTLAQVKNIFAQHMFNDLCTLVVNGGPIKAIHDEGQAEIVRQLWLPLPEGGDNIMRPSLHCMVVQSFVLT